MVRLLALLLIVHAAAAGDAPGALRSERLPGDARWVAHVDVRSILDGPLGAPLRSWFDRGDGRKLAIQAELFAGADLLRDVDAVTAWGPDGLERNVLIAFAGRFDRERLAKIAELAEDHLVQQHREHVIHSWVDASKPGRPRGYGSIAKDGTLVIAQDATALRRALDVRDGIGAGLVAGALAERLAHPQRGAVLRMAAVDLPSWRPADPRAQTLEQVRDIDAWLGVAGGHVELGLAATATDEAAATKIQAVAQGLLALVQLQSGGGPEQERLRQLAGSLRVDRQGATLQCALARPVDEIRALLQQILGGGR